MIEKGDIVIVRGKRYKVKSVKKHLNSCTIRSLDDKIVFYNVYTKTLKKEEKERRND